MVKPPLALTRLDAEAVHRAARALARRDPALRNVLLTYGPPPLWAREPGFATLVHLILEQQVSLASALAAFLNLKRACRGVVTPRKLLRFDDAELKTIGFSRQKAGYARELAHAILERRFDPTRLIDLDDDSVRRQLVALKGIGPWTADVYLLMVLLRPDAWPHGDVALAAAAQDVYGLSKRPTFEELNVRAEGWRPHRATAARLLWHHYLSKRGRSG
jgi:DNA-3-methyladenine glycosylase II